MNLYVINESRRAAVYGIGTYIRELIAALRQSNIKVCVVNLISDKPQINKEEINGIRHWYFPSPIWEQRTIEDQKQSELYYRNIVYLLQLYIEDKKNLIFHLNYNQSRKLAEELKRAFYCRIVTTIHSFDWCFNLLGNVTHFRKILTDPEVDQDDKFEKTVIESYLKDKEFFEIVDHIICLSENMFQILLVDYQINCNKLTIINNGISDRNQTSDNQTLRQKYHIPDIPIILFAGRLDEIKGLTKALRAFRIVLKTLPHCHFLIAGNGSFDMYLQECEDIWTYITWIGLINKEKLYDLYSIADIGIMPSFHEQCSYVAIEMMMHGLPIIGSTSTGLKEMIVDGETGLHIPVIEYNDKVEIDSSLLAEKMLYLLQHPEERIRMGINARKRYEKLYSNKVFRYKMINFYHSLYEQD